MATEITLELPDGPRKLRAALADPAPALRAIGEIVVSEANLAFQAQQFGDFRWPPRYPDQPEPFANIAGIVRDLNAGSRVKQRRFDRRPAGIDTRTLARSPAAEVVSRDTVRIGSNVPYADMIQSGGTGTQEVTETAKEGLKKFLSTDLGRLFKPRLRFLFGKSTLETRVHARPFLGLTDQMQSDAIRTVEQFIAQEATN